MTAHRKSRGDCLTEALSRMEALVDVVSARRIDARGCRLRRWARENSTIFLLSEARGFSIMGT